MRSTKIGVLAGRVLDVPMAVTADGTQLALVENARVRGGTTCATLSTIYAFDLDTHRLAFVQNAAPGVQLSLAWHGAGLAVLVDHTVIERRVGCATCSPLFTGQGGSALSVFTWKGQLAVVADDAIRTVEGAGLGPSLGSGLPSSVAEVSVDPSGSRLLVWGGLQTVRDQGTISFRTTYLWSAGQATYVTGDWIDPSW